MENPASWTEAEHVVHEALMRADAGRAAGRMGHSRAMQVTNALRAAGLLRETPRMKVGDAVYVDSVADAEYEE